MTTYQPLRLAIIGGNRGFSYADTMLSLPEHIQPIAVCDLDESVFPKWKERFPEIETFMSY